VQIGSAKYRYLDPVGGKAPANQDERQHDV